MHADDVRVRQLARMLELPERSARSLETSDALRLGDAIFEEAANSDDVTSEADAVGYLDARLAFFGALLPANVNGLVRDQFIARWRGWEQV